MKAPHFAPPQLDAVFIDGCEWLIPTRSKHPTAPTTAQSAETPVKPRHPHAAASSSVPQNVSEVGPDRVVETGWGKTRPH